MYTIDVLVQGFPGRSVHNGTLGWATLTLLRGEGRVILLDVGSFSQRKLLAEKLAERGLKAGDVTDVILTHAHYDHAVNFALFPRATIWIGKTELDWAAAQPAGFNPLPELYVRELTTLDRVRLLEDGEEFLPGLVAYGSPGHTPGHMIFHLTANDAPVLFTGDAAKNRAELLGMDVKDTADRATSQQTLEKIWTLWRAAPDTVLIPGHDLCMRLDGEGRIEYLGERKAAIYAWFSESLETTTIIDLCCNTAEGLFSSALTQSENTP
jgi:glyoxylase-like metal-dependent hydrolase (beta-lactamase superfamily II)